MSSDKKVCLFIVGMHRSGTSALAGSVYRMGFNIGKNLMRPTAYNPRGYYENMEVFRLNEEILSRVNLRWNVVPESFKIKIAEEDKRKFKNQIKNLLSEEFGLSDKVVIKDPRISLFPDLWTEAVSELGYISKFCICYRDPIDVCNSLYNRDGMSYEQASFLYLFYIGRAIRQTSDHERILVDYKDLLSAKSNYFTYSPFFNKLYANINRASIDEFIDGNLNHSVDSRDVRVVLPPFVLQTYEYLSQEDYKKLIVIYDKLKTVKPSFNNACVDDLKESLRDVKKAKEELTVKFEIERSELISQLNTTQLIGEKQMIALSKQVESSKKILNEIKLESNKKVEDLIAKNKELSSHIDTLKSDHRKAVDLLNMLNEEEKAIQQIQIEESRNKIKSLVVAIEAIQKDKEILRVHKNQLHGKLTKKDSELLSLKNSFSHKLGFALTLPVRVLYELGGLVNLRTIRLMPMMAKVLLRNPRLAIRAIKPHNINKLKLAVNLEDSKLTSKNISEYFLQLNEFEVEGSKAGKNDIVWKVDEAGYFSDVIMVRGWAIAKNGIKTVEIRLLGQNWLQMEYGRKRPDIGLVYPGYKNSSNSEFFINIKQKYLGQDVFIRIVSHQGVTLESKIDLEDKEKFLNLSLNDQYYKFLKQQKDHDPPIDYYEREIQSFHYNPLISIVVPVYNVDPQWLDACIRSVVNQYYTSWELCMYDDASTNSQTIECLRQWENKDPRIKIAYGETNLHISESSNQAILLASGEYIGLLDHDDELTKDALFYVVRALNDNDALKFIYSDEDKIDMYGRRIDPHFKSDFNLDMLRSNNYIAHFTVISKKIGDKVGWFSKGLEGSQDHDLYLKVIDNISVSSILHIPRVLYHWRKIPGSTAEVFDNKNYAISAGIRAIKRHLDRRGIKGKVEKGLWRGSYKVTYRSNGLPKVSIIIPFRDHVQLLKNCINSIKANTEYTNYELILVNNNSSAPDTLTYLQTLAEMDRIMIANYTDEFNYSKINNWAVQKAEGELVLLLNNDIEVISQGWLKGMVHYFHRDDVGAVGAKLLYDDDTIQHAGVILGIGGVAGHSHKYLHNEQNGYFSRHRTIQNLSACTAACLMVRKKLFNKVRGLDEDNLKIAFNDVDLCLKIREAGYLIVYTPYVELYHFESKSRGLEDTPDKLRRFKKEVSYFKEKWSAILTKGDPYYNSNLSLEKEDFSLNIS